ncbi:MAG: ATP-dependent RecD-like DNA helicase [Clostridia bacterium]|nr:ATP-dependent RecD-like DNA helicase [Clostridia bacterium]
MTELTADQIAADKLIGDWFLHSTKPIFVLAGYAGTGKTTLLKHTVCETLGLVPDESAAFVTPTGKAATVLIRGGINATTLHRLIYQSMTEEVEIEINGKTVKIEKLFFKRRETIDKAIKLIVLDEASMVSDSVLFDLLEFGVKLLLCGDNAQLPPVEGMNTFLKQPDYTLTEIVRQQQDNPIIKLAQMAREGKFIPYGKYGESVAVINKRLFTGERRKNYFLKADQIICGINKTRAVINAEMRSFRRLGPLPETGDKLICVLNNWEQYIDSDYRFNLVNGIIGTAHDPFYDSKTDIGFMQFKPDFLDEFCPEAIPFDTGIFTQDRYIYKHGDYFEKFDENGEPVGAFTLNRFEYGYCISCHKAQGSEYDNVIVFDESYAFKEDKDRWLYTAITRAKKKLILLR